jgi:glyoxylase-like metal-dependent hydrolase (beta-lactamase superfamily II)
MDATAGAQIGMMDVPLWRPRVMAFMAEMIRAGAERAYRLPHVETVRDGEQLDLPGRPRVIATPGHTAGHASYLLAERRALCAGDALVTNAIVRGGFGPQLLSDVFHHDAAQARASLEHLAGLDVGVLLPGHGRPWRGPISEAVEQARR